MRHLPLALTLAAAPLAAQQGFDISATEACMAEAYGYEERQYCVGAAARQCMEYLGDSEGLARCAAQETAWWETRMAASVTRISADDSLSATQVDALAKMQAAWRAYVDESCAFELAFGADHAASLAECLLWKTGDQAVLLEDYLPRN